MPLAAAVLASEVSQLKDERAGLPSWVYMLFSCGEMGKDMNSMVYVVVF